MSDVVVLTPAAAPPAWSPARRRGVLERSCLGYPAALPGGSDLDDRRRYLLGRRPLARGRTSRRRGDAARAQEAPARIGMVTSPTWSSSVAAASPSGAHQHATQAHAVTNGVSSTTATGSVRGLVLIANAAMAPTATSAAPIMTAGSMPSTNSCPEP